MWRGDRGQYALGYDSQPTKAGKYLSGEDKKGKWGKNEELVADCDQGTART